MSYLCGLNINKILSKNILFIYSILFFSIIFLDRITKNWALLYCKVEYKINSFLSCLLSFNKGISWGMFYSDSYVIYVFLISVLTLVSLGILIYIFNAIYRNHENKNRLYGEILILAGAVSNIIDRVMYKAVIDFISFSFNIFNYNFIWPSFNIADSAIVIGVIIAFLNINYDK